MSERHNNERQIRSLGERRVRTRVLASQWEVLLARMLLRVVAEIGRKDEDQEWTDLYNQTKQLAEGVLRDGR